MYRKDADSLIFCAILSKNAFEIRINPQIFTKSASKMVYTGEGKRRWNPVELYIDSYIVSSFWLHLLCLRIWDIFGNRGRQKVKRFRVPVAALICALTDAVALILGSFTGISEALLWSAVAILELVTASVIAFGRYRIIRNSIILLGTTALLAGIVQLLPVTNVGLYCLAGSVLLPAMKRGVTSLLYTRQTECMLYEAKLTQNGKEKALSAFMDTGNRLRLFGSNLPVVVVDEKYLTDWIKEAECFMPQKLVVLPYKGVGGTGLLRGVRVMCTLISKTGKEVETEVAAVAAGHKLFHGCTYQMILQPEVIACVSNTQEGEEHVI